MRFLFTFLLFEETFAIKTLNTFEVFPLGGNLEESCGIQDISHILQIAYYMRLCVFVVWSGFLRVAGNYSMHHNI